MRELVGGQAVTGRSAWPIPASAKEDVVPGGQRGCMQPRGDRVGGGARVHPHGGEVRGEGLFHGSPDRYGQRRTAIGCRALEVGVHAGELVLWWAAARRADPAALNRGLGEKADQLPVRDGRPGPPTGAVGGPGNTALALA
jgi:hypothetical protein